jgi:hypothetical protein
MDHDQNFSSLRKLLAASRLDMPQDTQIDQFLIEFHRRQRAQLLVPQPVWVRAFGWIKERAAGFQLLPTLSYGSAIAAIAVVACLGLSQQVQVTQVDGQSRLSFRMPAHESSFAMIPVSLISAPVSSPKVSDTPNFSSGRNEAAATRYVLANNSPKAYDATVAF